MDVEEKIGRLEQFKAHLESWQKNHDVESRKHINQGTVWVLMEVMEAGCFHTMTIGPPPAGGRSNHAERRSVRHDLQSSLPDEHGPNGRGHD